MRIFPLEKDKITLPQKSSTDLCFQKALVTKIFDPILSKIFKKKNETKQEPDSNISSFRN